MGDDPIHVMMQRIIALSDEYQSKENAKRVLHALKENARQGFWNGSLPPIGYRVLAANSAARRWCLRNITYFSLAECQPAIVVALEPRAYCAWHPY